MSRRCRPWTEVETVLVRLIAETEPYSPERRVASLSFCTAFGRTRSALDERARRLGLSRPQDGRSHLPGYYAMRSRVCRRRRKDA